MESESREHEPTPVQAHAVGYRDLLADLEHSGCCVCRGASRSAWRLIEAILWESVNDPATRLRLRASHGFCRDHLYMGAKVASSQAGGLGMAILLEDFLAHFALEATRLAARPSRRGRRHGGEALSSHGSCMACVTEDQVAFNYLAILSSVDDPDEVAVTARRPDRGLCVPHLTRGFTWFPGSDARKRLVDIFLPSNASVRRDLAGYIRKHDYLNREEGMTDRERTAWPRAIVQLVGAPKPTHPPRR
jgi:Family of unknown function (DUF6062)